MNDYLGMTLKISRRAGIVAATSLATVLALATPALAHTEISLDPAQAGASSATLKVRSEAENDAAGIESVQMFMPQGVDAAKVTLAAGPDGWTLKAGADNVTVSGTPLPTKADAEFSLKLGPLPATESSLTFKTLVTYADGKIDRWIGAPGSSNPAPTVSLAPAGAVSTTNDVVIRSEAPGATSAVSAPDSSSSSGAIWWIIGIAVLAVAAVGLWLMARRRRGVGPTA